MNNPVILVGNGTSLLDREQGDLIDSHEIVCRFNACLSPGFEQHSGTRTNVWFTVFKHDAKRVATLRPLERIIVHSWKRDAEKCAVFQSYGGEARASKLPHEIISRMNAYMGSNAYRMWSTGALAIWMMLETNPRVTITGYDWWSRAAHHYADLRVRGNLHRPEIEKQLVDRLTEEGRLEFLETRSSRHDLQHGTRPCPLCDAVDRDDAGDECRQCDGGTP